MHMYNRAIYQAIARGLRDITTQVEINAEPPNEDNFEMSSTHFLFKWRQMNVANLLVSLSLTVL